MELYRWANGKGQRALDILLNEQFMNKETYDIIKKRISSEMEVSSNSSSSNLRANYEDTTETLPIEPTSFAKELGDVQPSGYSNRPSLEEIRRLVIIGNHEGSVLNYSSWSELLGYSAKSSVSDFFRKMEGMNVLTLEKTPHGTKVKLTPYGTQLIIR